MVAKFEPQAFYEAAKKPAAEELQVLYKRRKQIAWLRFTLFLLTLIAVYGLWNTGFGTVLTAIGAGIAAFLFAVSKDAANNSLIQHTEKLLAINEAELSYLRQQYTGRPEGKWLEPPHHAYAHDLDVFGTTSLFQYVNRCNSEQGFALLGHRLLHPLPKAAIVEQQQAVQEIAEQIPAWQQFQAFGLNEKITLAAEQRIGKWLAQPDGVYTAAAWKAVVLIYPLITVTAAVLFAIGVLPWPLFSGCVFIFFVTGLAISSKITAVYTLLSNLVPFVNTLYNQLNWLGGQRFRSSLLTGLQQLPGGMEHGGAAASIKALQKILERFDVRLNALVFFVLNTFFLWDLWQVLALNNWRNRNRQQANAWFKTIAEVEVTGSLAVLHFNNPGWCFPQIADAHFTLSCRQVGHPLIAKAQSVTNDFELTGTARVDLVTGSNMGGKSTFLRSIGVNMVLAYAGSCVHATSFTVSVAELMSSMRIEDNLAENTSTFYAELKKLKLIIEAVNTGKPLFILLDEILRGTNSLDRHAGSEALIQQLIRKQAVAIIATHDIQLSTLAKALPDAIKNYHFDVQVNNEKLFFDYKLKQGVCQSMNATILMKQIGIELPATESALPA